MNIFIVLLVSFSITLIFTPLFRRLAIKLKIFDLSTKKKVHKKNTPYLGGIAIYLGFLINLLLLMAVNNLSYGTKKQLIIIMIGATIMLIAGLIDDIKNVPGIYKLIFEFIVVIILFNFGLRIDFLDKILNSTILNFIFTVLWVVFIINAFNNIDGLDGLAAGLAVIISFFFSVIYGSNVVILILCLTIMGSCLAFLIYNSHPAKIFMGDSGSLFLGFLIAAIPIMDFVRVHNLMISLLVPLLVVGLIMFDSSYVLIKRFVKRKYLLKGDLEHIHYRLYRRFGQRKATVLLYTINFLLGVIALILLYVFK